MLGYLFDENKMICAIVWIAVIASLYLPESYGRSQPFCENVEKRLHLPPIYGNPVPCGYRDLTLKYWENCPEVYLDDIFPRELDDSVLTGQDLLEKISTACSNYDAFKKCASCTAKHDCPEERDMIYEALIGKWSIFCEKDKVSGWLQTILQEGYSYNRACEDRYLRTFSCYHKLRSQFKPYNDTAYQLITLSEQIDE